MNRTKKKKMKINLTSDTDTIILKKNTISSMPKLKIATTTTPSVLVGHNMAALPLFYRSRNTSP